eukprot:3572164-Prorocentrum_lima.AAC.1
MTSSLVGSEMCIRDSPTWRPPLSTLSYSSLGCRGQPSSDIWVRVRVCAVSYTHLTLPTICSV